MRIKENVSLSFVFILRKVLGHFVHPLYLKIYEYMTQETKPKYFVEPFCPPNFMKVKNENVCVGTKILPVKVCLVELESCFYGREWCFKV